MARYRQAEIMAAGADAASGSNAGYMGIIRRVVTAGAGGGVATDRFTITAEHSFRLVGGVFNITTEAGSNADWLRLWTAAAGAGTQIWGDCEARLATVAGANKANGVLSTYGGGIALDGTVIGWHTAAGADATAGNKSPVLATGAVFAAAGTIVCRTTDTDGAFEVQLHIKPE